MNIFDERLMEGARHALTDVLREMDFSEAEIEAARETMSASLTGEELRVKCSVRRSEASKPVTVALHARTPSW